MTCIAALVDNGTVWMGGDSAGVGGLSITARMDAKVFRNGPYLMGFTSSFRMGQLLQYKLKPPKQHPSTPIFQFMVTDFIDAVRQCLKDGGYAAIKDGVEEAGTFLVGYCSRIFRIDCDYQVGESLHQFSAVGCGDDLALGAMHALTGSATKPHDRIEAALLAASEFSAGVCGPFTILELPAADETDGGTK